MVDSSRALPALHYVAIALVTALAYSAVRQHQFVWDTIPFVLENPWIHEWSLANLVAIFTEAHHANWHPFVLLSHKIDFTLFGYNSGAHHIVNVIYHIVNACLVYALTLRLLELANADRPRGNHLHWRWIACFTAIVFAIHPQHVESVAWVVERKDVLYSLFALLCLHFYIATYIDTRSQNNYRHHLIPFGFFCLAIASKPMAVTLPAILVLLDIFPLKNIHSVSELVRSCWHKSHYWLVSLLVILVTLSTQSMAMPSGDNLPLQYRALNAIDNTWFYLQHYIWPVNLSPYYPYPNNAAFMKTVAFWLPGAAFLTTSLGVCTWLLLKGIRWPIVLLGFYLITLSPVSGLIHVGPAKGTDHYVYLATLPFSLLSALLVYWIYIKVKALRLLTLALATSYLIFLFAITLPQVSYWNNHLLLWGRVLTLYPDSSFAHRNMAAAYVEIGDFHTALVHGEQSLLLGSPDIQYVEKLRAAVNKTNLKE